MGNQSNATPLLQITTQHRQTNTKVHAVRRIQAHDLSDQAVKDYTSDPAATGTVPELKHNFKFQN